MKDTEKILLGVVGVGVVGAIIYFATRPKPLYSTQPIYYRPGVTNNNTASTIAASAAAANAAANLVNAISDASDNGSSNDVSQSYNSSAGGGAYHNDPTGIYDYESNMAGLYGQREK